MRQVVPEVIVTDWVSGQRAILGKRFSRRLFKATERAHGRKPTRRTTSLAKGTGLGNPLVKPAKIAQIAQQSLMSGGLMVGLG